MAKHRMSNEEFERQFAEATKRGEQAMKSEPQAASVNYDQARNNLVINMKNGVTLILPCDLIDGLREAAPEEIAEVELLPRGAALHWEKLDVDLSLTGLLVDLFGSKAWMAEMGRRGGSVTSEAKAKAVRANGRKGGRPRNESRQRG